MAQPRLQSMLLAESIQDLSDKLPLHFSKAFKSCGLEIQAEQYWRYLSSIPDLMDQDIQCIEAFFNREDAMLNIQFEQPADKRQTANVSTSRSVLSSVGRLFYRLLVMQLTARTAERLVADNIITKVNDKAATVASMLHSLAAFNIYPTNDDLVEPQNVPLLETKYCYQLMNNCLTSIGMPVGYINFSDETVVPQNLLDAFKLPILTIVALDALKSTKNIELIKADIRHIETLRGVFSRHISQLILQQTTHLNNFQQKITAIKDLLSPLDQTQPVAVFQQLLKQLAILHSSPTMAELIEKLMKSLHDKRAPLNKVMPDFCPDKWLSLMQSMPSLMRRTYDIEEQALLDITAITSSHQVRATDELIQKMKLELNAFKLIAQAQLKVQISIIEEYDVYMRALNQLISHRHELVQQLESAKANTFFSYFFKPSLATPNIIGANSDPAVVSADVSSTPAVSTHSTSPAAASSAHAPTALSVLSPMTEHSCRK